jgi:hypothetical protein
MRKYLLTIILSTGLVVAAIFVLRAQQVSSQEIGIGGPSSIVEFVGVWTRSEPGQPASTGYLFRGPDGSERHESGPDLQRITLVSIKNIANETLYMWNRGKWTAQPMQLGGEGAPFPRNIDKRRLAPNPSGQKMTHENIEVVQMAQNGVMTRVAPALNFFGVDQVMPNGTRMVLTNIQVGPVEPVARTLSAPQAGPARNPLFEPPADAWATLEWHAKPGGIIVDRRSRD